MEVKEATYFPGAGSTDNMWGAMWVLGIKTEAYTKAKIAVNIEPTFQGQYFNFFNLVTFMTSHGDPHFLVFMTSVVCPHTT